MDVGKLYACRGFMQRIGKKRGIMTAQTMLAFLLLLENTFEKLLESPDPSPPLEPVALVIDVVGPPKSNGAAAPTLGGGVEFFRNEAKSEIPEVGAT